MEVIMVDKTIFLGLNTANLTGTCLPPRPTQAGARATEPTRPGWRCMLRQMLSRRMLYFSHPARNRSLGCRLALARPSVTAGKAARMCIRCSYYPTLRGTVRSRHQCRNPPVTPLTVSQRLEQIGRTQSSVAFQQVAVEFLPNRSDFHGYRTLLHDELLTGSVTSPYTHRSQHPRGAARKGAAFF